MKNIYFIIGILFFIMTSCDLLSTRNPEPPKSSNTNYIAATTPELLFQNLKSSVEDKIVENYMACLVDSSYLQKNFNFIPAGGVITQYPILNTWGLQSEKQYFNNLNANLQQNAKISLAFSNTQNTPLGDSAIYISDYNLTITSSNDAISGTYEGTAQFKIFLDSRNQWVIVEWQDLKKENFPCWSDLKGRTY